MALSKEQKSTVNDVTKNLRDAKGLLDNAVKDFKSILDTEESALEDLKGELEDDFENMSEKVQEGDKGQENQSAISQIESICDTMDTVGDKLDEDVTIDLFAELEELSGKSK